MGYNAIVRCNCYKDGKIEDPPYKEFVIETIEGYELHFPDSLNLDEQTKNDMYDKFLDWLDFGCEHEYMEYCEERLTNISGMMDLKSILYDLGGDKEFPVLFQYLPEANSGFLPLEKMNDFENELDKLLSKGQISIYELICQNNNELVQSQIGKEEKIFFQTKEETMIISNGKFVIVNNQNKILFESSSFSVNMIENGCFEYLDINNFTKYISSYFFDEEKFKKTEILQYLIRNENRNILDEFDYLVQRFKKVIKAAREVNNPIIWC